MAELSPPAQEAVDVVSASRAGIRPSAPRGTPPKPSDTDLESRALLHREGLVRVLASEISFLSEALT